jgi:hypothetical protein
MIQLTLFLVLSALFGSGCASPTKIQYVIIPVVVQTGDPAGVVIPPDSLIPKDATETVEDPLAEFRVKPGDPNYQPPAVETEGAE